MKYALGQGRHEKIWLLVMMLWPWAKSYPVQLSNSFYRYIWSWEWEANLTSLLSDVVHNLVLTLSRNISIW